MAATNIAPLDYASAERKLNALPILANDRLVLEKNLKPINEASDSRHLELVKAHAAVLLHGMAVEHEVLAQVGDLFEAVAQHERERMVV